MSAISINATTERHPSKGPGTERPRTMLRRLSLVPWLTVVPMAVVLAYADGFWLISLRGAVGAVERAQDPSATWLRESTLLLPVYILAVLAALAVAARWFGPVLRRPKTVVATALLIVAAGTTVGVAATAANSAYDYHLQSSELQLTGSMRSMASMGSMGSTGHLEQATLGLQTRAVGYGSGIILVTNLLLVGWVVALRGGRLNVTSTRH
jgi:type III secretory pathway component EscS